MSLPAGVIDALELSWCRLATWVNTTRYRKYSQVLLMMGEKHRPKHVDPTWNNKLVSIVHLVGYIHSCITIHGFMNVDFIPHFVACFVLRKMFLRNHSVNIIQA